MYKIDQYLAYYRCKLEATQESVLQVIRFCVFFAIKQTSTSKKKFILSFLKNISDNICYVCAMTSIR